jgi:hypothetical protein
MSRSPNLTMTAVLSQRVLNEPSALASAYGEMAVWDPADELADPATAFERTDQRVLRILGSIGLLGLAMVAALALVQLALT